MILASPEHQYMMGSWLCEKIGLVPTPNLRCIGSVVDNRLVGVVGYDNYNDASIMMHSAGEGYWLTKSMLRAVFRYPFDICNVNMVIGLVPSGNVQAIKFNTHIGFRIEHAIEGAHPDGALLIMTMRRSECRYLDKVKENHGQEVYPQGA